MADAFWNEKVVLITGASSGIGLELTRYCYSQGARVGMIARRLDVMQAAILTMRDGPGLCATEHGDVSNTESTRSAIAALEEQLGACDILIANAGIYRKTSGTTFETRAATDVVNTNLIGVINAIGAVLPGMVRRQRGHLVAVSSILSLLGYPGAAAYAASKAAVVRMMDGLRIDLRNAGVRVTTICPGYVDTPMITDAERASMKGLISASAAARRIARDIEAGRPADWFPWTTYWSARLASCLPYPLYNRILGKQPPMEETD